MSGFVGNLSATKITDTIWRYNRPHAYFSERLNRTIIIQADPGHDYYCDFESVPRIPIVYAFLGRTDDEEGGLHDFLYRKDCPIQVSRREADAVYLEAMLASGYRNLRMADLSKAEYRIALLRMKAQAYSKWLGVRAGGHWSYHKKSINWKPEGVE